MFGSFLSHRTKVIWSEYQTPLSRVPAIVLPHFFSPSVHIQTTNPSPEAIPKHPVTMAAKSVAVITMSVRTPRVGPSVASFVKSILDAPAAEGNVALHSVDLADFNLPMFKEHIIPGFISNTDDFEQAAGVAWSAEIKKHDGYVLVIPEYNYSVSGATKNAVDYLMHEWKGKPIAVVSYGISGGAFASAHLSHSLGKMGLRVAETRPNLTFADFKTDAMAAMTKGELGETSKTRWSEEHEALILKTFEELKTLLAEEPKAEEKKQ
jgi:NAD(P)H-dependent FMN reductase